MASGDDRLGGWLQSNRLVAVAANKDHTRTASFGSGLFREQTSETYVLKLDFNHVFVEIFNKEAWL